MHVMMDCISDCSIICVLSTYPAENFAGKPTEE